MTDFFIASFYGGNSMTRDDITRLAREAGVPNSWDLNWFDPTYDRFAELVAAAEREACVKDVSNALYGQVGCGKAIEAIRARGQHE